jgi:hypothetical protein
MKGSKRGWAVAVLMLMFWSGAAVAADKNPVELQKTFDASVERVFAAQVQSVGAALKDAVKEGCMVNFNTSKGVYLVRWTATCHDMGSDRTVVTLSVAYADWFPGVGNEKKKQATAFWSNMDAALRSSAASGASSKSAAVKPQTGNEAVGLAQISSEPTGAEIEVDGEYAGNTPSQLKLKPGSHAIKITKKGFAPWERRISMDSGESRNIVADLEKSSQ